MSLDTRCRIRRRRSASTTGYRSGDEISPCLVDPRALVGVDLASRRLPAHSRNLIVFEQKPAIHRDPAGNLEARSVENDKVYGVGQAVRRGDRFRAAAEPRRDVAVVRRTGASFGLAAEEVGKARAGLA